MLTFLGFGELGYEDDAAFESIVVEELNRRCAREYAVNTATLITDGFSRGIADVYEIAHARGFRTSGVFPSVALRTPDTHSLSAFVEDVYFVRDPTWGGYLPNTDIPSQMLQALTAVSDEVVAIGGGKHTAQELKEFLQKGKPVRYHALEMNRAVSRKWYEQQGERCSDFRGAAYSFWLQARTA